MVAKLARRLAEHAFERAIELRERLKSNVIRHFADAPIRIQQLRACVFKPDPRNVICKL